jgi:hypothetical protein
LSLEFEFSGFNITDALSAVVLVDIEVVRLLVVVVVDDCWRASASLSMAAGFDIAIASPIIDWCSDDDDTFRL